MPEAPAKTRNDIRAGRYLSALRYRRGLSPEQMGRQAGVGGSTIRDIEKKGIVPQLATQQRIATFLDLDKSDIWRRRRG